MARAKNINQKNNGANVGYEAQLWQMADALRVAARSTISHVLTAPAENEEEAHVKQAVNGKRSDP